MSKNTNRKVKVHKIKLWTQYFDDVASGVKTFEVRYNDCDYQVGDVLLLREYVVCTQFGFGVYDGYFTDRVIYAKIKYILSDIRYVLDGFVILGIEVIP